jgi:PAS domain S-box-containing protein
MSQSPEVKVLLVDDQPNNLLALESVLADLDITLIKAHSGIEALRQLLDQEFAVVLLDVQMPEIDGLETARLIRGRDKSRDTPIIFVTAMSRNEANVFKGYELGAVDYIFKPFPAPILRSKVNVFAELFRKREAFKLHAQALARLTRQNELVLKSVGEGVLGVDLDGVVTFVNPGAARMIGRSPAEISGLDMHALVHPDSRVCNGEDCPLHASLHGQRGGELEENFVRADGTIFPVEVCASPMKDDDGSRHGSVVSFRDVTEKRAALLAAEAENRYREAEAQNRAKDNFLAILSHELRTPMTSIIGWIQFLQSGPCTPEEMQEAHSSIASSARLQAHLIDDMLDVSRIVLGKFNVELRHSKIAEIVDAALVLAHPAATEKDVHLTLSRREADAELELDPPRIQQAIGNILSNAIKFSHPGDTVELSVMRTGSTLSITVSDGGEGIDPSFLPHVFDRLSQGDAGANRKGLGLGLAISRYIIELHHGEIRAESEGVGKGARFTVTLPMSEPRLENSETQETASVAG